MSNLGERANWHWNARMGYPADVRYLWQPFSDLTLREQRGELESRLESGEIDSPDKTRTAIELYDYDHWKDFMVELNAACTEPVTGRKVFRDKADHSTGTIAEIIDAMRELLHCYPIVLEGKTQSTTTIAAFNPKSKTSPVCSVEFTDADPAGAFINPYGDNGK